MQWTSALLLLLILLNALFAAWGLGVVARRCNALSAEHAALSSSFSRLETTERLTPSKLVELSETRDAITKGTALLKRINQREVMAERRVAIAESERPPDDPAQLKAYLRRKAGLVAGRPAPHRELQ